MDDIGIGMTTILGMNRSTVYQLARLRRINLFACSGQAILGLGQLAVLTFLIGFDALTNSQLLRDLALSNPTPLYVQDVLKLLSLPLSFAVLRLYHVRLAQSAPRQMRLATLFGVIAMATLLANALLSILTTARAGTLSSMQGDQAGAVIGALGILAIMANGVWFLIAHWCALRTTWLPKPLAYVGMLTGFLSLLPPLFIVVLVLSAIWAMGLFVSLIREGERPNVSKRGDFESSRVV